MRLDRHKNANHNMLITPMILVVLGLVLWLFFQVFFSGGWEGKSRFTVVFITSPVIVVSFNPADNSLTSVSIPSDTYVDATHGYGQYRLGKIYDVGNLDHRGGEVLKSTVRELLGIPIDGYIDLNQQSLTNSQSLSGVDFVVNRDQLLGWQNLFNLFSKKTKTDLRMSDIWQFYSKTGAVKAGKITFVNLINASVLISKQLPDGTNILVADQLRMDGLLRDLFHEDNIASENLKMVVLNSTDTAGLGDKIARIINNMGIQVVNVSNYAVPVQDCRLYLNKSMINSLTVVKLKRIFGCSVVDKELPDVRADIAFVVGKKYSLELQTK